MNEYISLRIREEIKEFLIIDGSLSNIDWMLKGRVC